MEIRADIVVSVVSQQDPSITPNMTQERIDWWLEEGGDECVGFLCLWLIPPLVLTPIFQCTDHGGFRDPASPAVTHPITPFAVRGVGEGPREEQVTETEGGQADSEYRRRGSTDEIEPVPHYIDGTQLSGHPYEVKRTDCPCLVVQEDESILSSTSDLPLNKKHAVIVRLGEKRILQGLRDQVATLLSADARQTGGKNKRKGGTSDEKSPSAKKSRR